MFTIHVKGREYGPFGYYSSALAFARERWAEYEFYIKGPHSDDVFV
jgi:hypothetical protein